MFRVTSASATAGVQGLDRYIPPNLRRMFYKNPAAVHASHNGLDPYGFMTRGLVLYLPLWALKGSGFKSVDAYGHTATVTGATWGTTGRTFNGASGSISCGSASVLDDLGPLTYIAWIKPTSTGEGGAGRMLHKESATGGDVGTYLAMGGIASCYLIVDYATTDLFRYADNNSLTLGVWQQVIVTWDGSRTAANSHLYVNTVEVTYQTTTDGVGDRVTDAANNQFIGNAPSDAITFDGLVGEDWIYNRVLSAGERTHNYNCTAWRYQ